MEITLFLRRKVRNQKNVSKPKIWEITSIPFAKFKNNKYNNKTEDLKSNIITTKPKKFNLKEEGVSNEDEKEEAVLLTPKENDAITQLEYILQKGPINLTPLTLIPNGWIHIDPIARELSTEVRGLLVELINIKCSKKEAIKLVFGVTKGTSKKYKAASYWYEEIKEQIK